MKPYKYKCPKCGHQLYDQAEARMVGSFLHKIFDIQNLKFTVITCKRCSFSEFYKIPSKKFGNVVDFITG